MGVQYIKATCRTHAVAIMLEVIQSVGIKMNETDRYSITIPYNAWEIVVDRVDHDLVVIQW